MRIVVVPVLVAVTITVTITVTVTIAISVSVSVAVAVAVAVTVTVSVSVAVAVAAVCADVAFSTLGTPWEMFGCRVRLHEGVEPLFGCPGGCLVFLQCGVCEFVSGLEVPLGVCLHEHVDVISTVLGKSVDPGFCDFSDVLPAALPTVMDDVVVYAQVFDGVLVVHRQVIPITQAAVDEVVL
jgi:hypothetical protein